ncbi:MAG: hypothetical protein PVJ33_13265 [Lysobacterales bacterium]|jgi:hypothetical protein
MYGLSEILAEQGSPAEVLVFLAVTVVVFLVVAFVIYVLIMALLRLGLPKPVPMRRVLFPSGKRLRENLGDYVLAASTSILLALTLMVKHELVQQIQGFDMAKVEPEAVAVVFDFGLTPELAREISHATLGEVVGPLLKAGKVEQSDLLVRYVTQLVPKGWLTPAVLISACIVLAVFYLLWLARRRYLALNKSPDSAPEYAKTFRPLMTLALCVGLLLASALPLAEGGQKFLARSAMDAIQESGRSQRAQTSEVSRLISQELRKQRERAAFLYCADCEDPGESIWQTVERGTDGPNDLQPLIERVNETAASCQSACEAQAAELAAALDPLRSRFAGMDSALEELRRGLAQLGERQIPELARNQEQDRARLDQALADMGRQLALLRREAERFGAMTDGWEELQRRVARLESFHNQRVIEPDRESLLVCRRLATIWAQQSQQNQESRCGFSGESWTTDTKAQYERCLNAPADFRDRETRARNEQLSRCRPPVQ